MVRLHKDVSLSCSSGNGNVTLNVPKLGDIALGNGSLRVDGGLRGDAGISIGNGNLQGSLAILSGTHDIAVGNGRVSLKLAAGSSCAVTADAAMGQIDAQGFTTQRDWHVTGGTVTGMLGSGRGKLHLSIGNGAISLEALQQ
jgi:DUF4097 and DUF4098 domain-containing protein YvlB